MTVTIGYTTDDDFIAFALARGVTVTAPNAAIVLTKSNGLYGNQAIQRL